MIIQTPVKTPLSEVTEEIIKQFVQKPLICYIDEYPILCYVVEDDTGFVFNCHVTDECVDDVTHVILMMVV